MTTFKSTRKDPSKHNKYTDFEVLFDADSTIEIDCDKLLDHEVSEMGILTLHFENNRKMVMRGWATLDYGYDMPQ